jgi:hypothetical protein
MDAAGDLFKCQISEHWESSEMLNPKVPEQIYIYTHTYTHTELDFLLQQNHILFTRLASSQLVSAFRSNEIRLHK